MYLEATGIVAASVGRWLHTYRSCPRSRWRPEPELGPLCMLRKAWGVLILANVHVPNIKFNREEEVFYF